MNAPLEPGVLRKPPYRGRSTQMPRRLRALRCDETISTKAQPLAGHHSARLDTAKQGSSRIGRRQCTQTSTLMDMWTSPAGRPESYGPYGQAMDIIPDAHTLSTLSDLSPTYPQVQQQER